MRLTSNPVGAVTVILADNPDPEAVKLCGVDAAPEIDVNAVSVPLVVIVGPEAIV